MSADSIVRGLATELKGEVRADDATRAAYATDASNHRVVPLCVVLPRDADDVVRLVERCADANVPITSRGAGTNTAGNAIGPGVIVDFSRHMTAVLDIDPAARTAVVEPGVVLDRLRDRAAAHGLTFGADPSTHNRCTLGGMIGTNACGSHSVAWGTTADNVDELDVVLADGSCVTLGRHGDQGDGTGAGTPLLNALAEVRNRWLADIRLELGRFPRQISGYGLQHLLPENGFHAARALVGAEGTCGLVTRVRVRLVPLPAARVLVVAGFADDLAAAAAAPALAAAGPLTVEGINDRLVAAFDSRPAPQRRPELPAGRAWLLLEVGADDPAAARDHAEAVRRSARDQGALDVHVVVDHADQRAYWRIRERGAGLATRTADGREAWPGWEDAAVPPARLAGYLKDFRELLDRYGRQGVVYGHFGEGCVHVRIDHDLLSESGRAAYRSFQEDAADLVVAHGGSLSGEHGDGRARSELLPRMYGERIRDAFAAFKHAFDPLGRFNPGVLVDPARLDADLRQTISRPHTADLAFAYHSDGGDFGKALRRCVGVGACRKQSGGGMCPSYRATRDERHSTRGRARILAEMLDGRLSADGWRSEHVKDALDLCLMCKACSAECPVTVDMATYKAEFLHQHYRGRLRPAAHYSMGWLPLWLAAGRRFARPLNAVLDVDAVAALARRLGGIDPARRLPRLATWSFHRWFRRRTGPADGDPVVLWVDSFTAAFAPEVARDAVHVLEAAGYRVEVPSQTLCCGLTWVSTGQLDIARRVMRRTVRALDRRADGDRPVVTLEPSCGAALRSDLPELVDGDGARRVASRIRTLAELLDGRELPFRADRPATAVVQFHCHQRAVFGTRPDRALLERAGVTVHGVDEGCCGLAGNFGFQAGHYEISKTCAEQSFLPHLEEHAPDAPVLADGFSCRLQIAEFGGRRPVHLARLLRERIEPAP
ncbi:lactate dehydrogenase [Actinomadura sp. NBRC 104412]|uniref:FAD-binding and (Fe-S)-binding domain-containing protein n=1 Tax=Actinomadura sp. NBRC 104412 TaxID=3032203 RepID=UPI0024A1EE3B|nr:FAD-binding and (Fe-S)-binding domain-containing protein [Actinomadura sp. NBRC 104412]GLZ04757.1 lactate dehydrogenase [Actinomadura sp. NBRC 104412]